jgi:site-specific recombinase XerD
VQLPLLKEVGWAVIDYIRHGRPACDCPQVFVRHTAPIGAFSDQDHLHQILVKHARVAHVAVGGHRRHGMHSLRHSLATRLMEDGTPVEQIADILGHRSVASTGVYLKSSLGLLAACALDPDAPGRAASR